jgi:hypothetical protein
MTISAVNSTGGPARTQVTAAMRPEGGIPVSEIKQLVPVTPLKAVHSFPMIQPIDPKALMEAMSSAGVTSDDAPSKLFAEVYKDGKVVARLYNGGSSVTYGKADGIISGENEPYDGGPQLAQWRANKIAAELGGTVKMADTAQTQSQWEVGYEAEQAKRDQAMAPYRAAMDAFRAQRDAWHDQATAQASKTV